MEFSINLLPQAASLKEKRTIFLIPILGIATVLAVTGFLAYSYFDMKNSIKTHSGNIEAQTALRDQLIKEHQEKNSGVTEYNFADNYREMHQVLSALYVGAVDSHEDVMALLPENAEVNAYTYSNNGELHTTISFYSKGDSAIFLNQLLGSKFVEQAEVELIEADEDERNYQSSFTIKLDTLAGERE